MVVPPLFFITIDFLNYILCKHDETTVGALVRSFQSETGQGEVVFGVSIGSLTCWQVDRLTHNASPIWILGAMCFVADIALTLYLVHANFSNFFNSYQLSSFSSPQTPLTFAPPRN